MDRSQLFLKYRNDLFKFGRNLPLDNPDHLKMDELQALSQRILEEIDKLDVASGYEPHPIPNITAPYISKEMVSYLFAEFLDWYNIVETPSNVIYHYVIRNYPTSKFPKILCVGDGECCHLGRKLAMKGYTVISVDPESKEEFSIKSNSKGGKLKVVKAQFQSNSEDMINWSSLIVGSKVPMCAESLVSTKKPTVFNISSNAEVHQIVFKGKPIRSSKQLRDEILKCKGVSVKKVRDELFDTYEDLFICNEREFVDR